MAGLSNVRPLWRRQAAGFSRTPNTFGTAGTVRSPQTDSATTVRSNYRALLRATRAAVRFSKPATKNLRRLLRDEAHFPATSENLPRTLSFLLSSSHSPRQYPDPDSNPERKQDHASDNEGWSAPRQSLPHKVIFNLASLTYHHLSPHTQMQPSKRKRAKHVRSISSTARLVQQLHQTGNMDDFDDESQTVASSDQVEVLRVLPKPVLGPVGLKPEYWDAQNPDRRQSTSIFAGSDQGGILIAEKDLQSLEVAQRQLTERKRELVEQARNKAILDSQIRDIDAQIARIKPKIGEIRGKIKSQRRLEARHNHSAHIAQLATTILADTVALAQATERLTLGTQRWQIKKAGGWLNP